jgi:16S rRNA A1518/A1519 N6-dimethyltransferase RsmA/KsgA/DIM1 with predicted DNA glycosylase/AP lyase activity
MELQTNIRELAYQDLLFKPEVYSDLLQINRLEHHSDHRKKFDQQSWQFHQKFVVNRIKTLRPQIMTSLGANIKEEQKIILDNLDNIIHESVCRLRTNTLQLNTENSKLRAAMGLYPIYSLLNHSCKSNTDWW